VTDRAAALAAFGEATHSIQDFYSHSNWLELAVERGAMPTAAPIVGSCEAAQLPSGSGGLASLPDPNRLQTGYYHATPFWTNGGPFVGCPANGPLNPYTYCHSTLNKDSPSKGKGAERYPNSRPARSYHQVARTLATDATRELWIDLGRRISQAYTPEKDNVNGACLHRQLGFGGSDACQDLSGAWRFGSGSDVARIAQQGKHIEASYTKAVPCTHGGEVRSLLRGDIVGDTLTGTVSICVAERVFIDCGFPQVIDASFIASARLDALANGIDVIVKNHEYQHYYDIYGIAHCVPTGNDSELHDTFLRAR
jgi:hypothetical protein